MFVVPLEGDTITTVDGGTYEVLSYTNYKPNGPAVYVGMPIGEASHTVYFFDIEKINGVKVEFDKSAKVFKALGKLKRKIHLPQPGDKIVVLKSGSELDDPDDEVTIKKIKLHNKGSGISKGLLFVDEDGDEYRLHDIISINRSVGSDIFDRKKFLSVYSEYNGFRG